LCLLFWVPLQVCRVVAEGSAPSSTQITSLLRSNRLLLLWRLDAPAAFPTNHHAAGPFERLRLVAVTHQRSCPVSRNFSMCIRRFFTCQLSS
jgi:hypothetical protein